MRFLIVLVFLAAGFACFMMAVKASQDGNKRKSVIFGIACAVLMTTAFVFAGYLGIIPEDEY